MTNVISVDKNNNGKKSISTSGVSKFERDLYNYILKYVAKDMLGNECLSQDEIEENIELVIQALKANEIDKSTAYSSIRHSLAHIIECELDNMIAEQTIKQRYTQFDFRGIVFSDKLSRGF